ncbi:MAG: hypothetical protein AAB316_16650 [Bacteroidota bacterium]
MNEETKQKLDAILLNGYDFKFGDYISRGFELLQKNLGGFILFTLVFFVLSSIAQTMGSFNQTVSLIAAGAASLFLTPPLQVGFYLVANQLHRGQPTEFGGFFKGFDFIGQLALMTLVKSLIILASLIPFVLAVWNTSDLVQWYIGFLQNPAILAEGGIEPPTFPPAWTFLLTLPAIYLSVAYTFAPLFVVFYRMEFWDALEYSRKLITQKWFLVFGFLIVTGLIAGAGIILLCIGILATFPAYLCMMYAAFEDITQLNREPAAGDDIEKHLIV